MQATKKRADDRPKADRGASVAVVVFMVVYDVGRRRRVAGFIGQWPFQDPKMEVPTIYKVYIRPM